MNTLYYLILILSIINILYGMDGTNTEGVGTAGRPAGSNPPPPHNDDMMMKLMNIGENDKYPFVIKPLPYGMGDLDPHISLETMMLHHDQHLMGYITNANGIIRSLMNGGMDMTEVIKDININIDTLKKKTLKELIYIINDSILFNNLGQIYNHYLFFNCLKAPSSSNMPTGDLLDLINHKFTSLEMFKEEFMSIGKKHFGSGWIWLIYNNMGGGGSTENDNLEIMTTDNANNPLRDGSGYPLLACDLWEHAYYVDYRNKRGDYLREFWRIINWEYIQMRLESAKMCIKDGEDMNMMGMMNEVNTMANEEDEDISILSHDISGATVLRRSAASSNSPMPTVQPHPPHTAQANNAHAGHHGVTIPTHSPANTPATHSHPHHNGNTVVTNQGVEDDEVELPGASGMGGVGGGHGASGMGGAGGGHGAAGMGGQAGQGVTAGMEDEDEMEDEDGMGDVDGMGDGMEEEDDEDIEDETPDEMGDGVETVI